MADVTAQVVPDPAKRAQIPNLVIVGPKGGSLTQTFSYDPSASPINATNSAVGTLNTFISLGISSLQQRFAVVQGNAELFVEPSGIRDQSGTMQNVSPLFATPISFPQQSRNAFATLLLILEQVSAARGLSIGPGTTPIRPFAETKVTMGAENEPARSVVIRLFQLACNQNPASGPFVAPVLSYALFIDPGSKKAALNIHFASVTTAPGPPANVVPSGNSSAFFEKKP